ncbi:hypothetical protein Glove_86g208 [Diversispora epigaea]|uniref:HNH nuclease domain-containing protein n=1 Tax=Diversispora epigaea TaxID=1348612 RepID=A0A397J6T1_9GLOM|nr:hypothetical protein Glove_86g208 [Diversispora epigaea]
MNLGLEALSAQITSDNNHESRNTNSVSGSGSESSSDEEGVIKVNEIWNCLVCSGDCPFFPNNSNLKMVNDIQLKWRGGYIRTDFNINGIRAQSYNHRLVAEEFIPNPENKLQVNHINGMKRDNRVDNLEWASKENANRKTLNIHKSAISRKTKFYGWMYYESDPNEEWKEIKFDSIKFKLVASITELIKENAEVKTETCNNGENNFEEIKTSHTGCPLDGQPKL